MSSHDLDTGDLSRRSVLTGGAAVVGGAAFLAGCGGSDAPVATAGSTTASTTAAPSAGGAALAQLADIPVGEAVAATMDGKPVIVAQPTAGAAVAFSAICTHKGCTVAPKGAKLACPCHGSMFDALTGEVLQGPASGALSAVPVTVKDGAVVAEGA